jgi:hypothetical protein
MKSMITQSYRILCLNKTMVFLLKYFLLYTIVPIVDFNTHFQELIQFGLTHP